VLILASTSHLAWRLHTRVAQASLSIPRDSIAVSICCAVSLALADRQRFIIGPRAPGNAITWEKAASRRPFLEIVLFFLTASVSFPSSLRPLALPPPPHSLILSFLSLPFQQFFLMFLPSLLAALGLAVPLAFAQQPGSFVVAGDTLVSAMMVRR
jgi:hypothetical protein